MSTAAARRMAPACPGAGGETLDCGNAGTAMRLLAGALAGRPAGARLVGDDSLSRRPMERVAVPLRRMGATVGTTDGHAPLDIDGRRPLLALPHELPVASAQVIGCIALAALAADGRTTIDVHRDRPATTPSGCWPGSGLPVRREGLSTTVDGPAGFAARSMTVPGDISSAGSLAGCGSAPPRCRRSGSRAWV